MLILFMEVVKMSEKILREDVVKFFYEKFRTPPASMGDENIIKIESLDIVLSFIILEFDKMIVVKDRQNFTIGELMRQLVD